jgi:hypothetical protein
MKWTEITGAELNKPFKVAGLDGEFAIIEYYDNRSQLIEVVSRVPSGDILAGCSLTPNEFCAIIHAAPAGIIHLPPPLTNEQREQLKAIWTLGGRYLAKDDASGGVFCYQTRPEKAVIEWTVRDVNDEFMEITYFVPAVAGLVSWYDPEPYDIGKALGVGE